MSRGPGAGKGTQSQRLCQHLHIHGILTGDVLRQAIAAQTDLGEQAKSYVQRGELVPDQLMIKFMGQRLQRPDVSDGWLLEGYPRTAFQAKGVCNAPAFSGARFTRRAAKRIRLESPRSPSTSHSDISRAYYANSRIL